VGSKNKIKQLYNTRMSKEWKKIKWLNPVLKWILQERGRREDQDLDAGKAISDEIVGKRVKGQHSEGEG
jgi:hypothetical protein